LTDQNNIYATQDEVIAALTALTADERRLLDYSARRLAFATIYATGPALFSEAIDRALELRRQWCPTQMPFVQFMRNTMASISNNDRTSFYGGHVSNVSALAAGDDEVDQDALLTSFSEPPKNSVTDVLEKAEEEAATLRDYDALYAFFSDDEEVWNILDAMEQGLIGAAIKEHCKLDGDRYNAARKRLNRGAAKLKSQRIKQ
jgi:hypothetical protein